MKHVRPTPPYLVIAVVCHHLGITPEDFYGRCRHPRFVLARELTVTLLRELTHLSYPECAAAMHRPNHSTIITAHQRFLKAMAAEREAGTADREGSKSRMLADLRYQCSLQRRAAS